MPRAEIAGWPAVYVYCAREYGYTPEDVNRLTLIQLCILLGAVTPDHKIRKLPMRDYLRFARTADNRRTLKEIHGR